MANASPASRQRPWLVVTGAITVVCLATAWGHGPQVSTPGTSWYGRGWRGSGLRRGPGRACGHQPTGPAAAELAAEQERLAQVEAGLRAVMRPLTLPAAPSTGPGRFGGSPAALLRADRQVVGFTGRIAELRGLRSWARGSSRGVVRLITGPGGSGKTRLAVEFAAQLEAEGWQCGQLQAGCGRQAIAAIEAAGKPTLLVVDYAEARTDLEPLLEGIGRPRRGPGDPGLAARPDPGRMVASGQPPAPSRDYQGRPSRC